MSTKTWLILKDGKAIVREDKKACYDCFDPYASSGKQPRIFNSYDEAVKEAKKLASKTLDDYVIFGSEVVTAVKVPDVDLVTLTAPTV